MLDEKIEVQVSDKHSLFIPPKFCILSVVSSFSLDHYKSQEIIKTMLMQNFGGTNKEYHGIFDIG